MISFAEHNFYLTRHIYYQKGANPRTLMDKGKNLIFHRAFENNGYDNIFESINCLYKYQVT